MFSFFIFSFLFPFFRKVPKDFLSEFHFSDLSGGGGKGGSPLAFLKNGYIVKELNQVLIINFCIHNLRMCEFE